MRTEGQTVRATGLKNGAAVVQLLKPTGLEITQTNQFDPPPQSWVKLEQWHLQAGFGAGAATAQPATAVSFVSVIRPYRVGTPEPPLGAQGLESDDALGCELELKSGQAVVVWRKPGSGPVALGEVTTDGEVACVVLSPDGKPRETFVHGGTSVKYRGKAAEGK